MLLSAPQMHVLAFARGGSVFSWGTGTNGQLGHGTTESVPIPLLIKGLDYLRRIRPKLLEIGCSATRAKSETNGE